MQTRTTGRPIDQSTESVEETSQQDLFDIVEQLDSEFKEFEKVREGIRTRISSIANLVPTLNERKERLQKEIDENLKGVQQLNRQVPKLNQQKEDLLQSIPHKQEKKAHLENQIHLNQEKVKEITGLLTKLSSERLKTEKISRHEQEEIAKIDDQINQIKSIKTKA